MTSRGVMKLMVGFYVLLFFGYLFGPLLMMGASAFNTSPFPQVAPWEGFTFKWFGALAANSDMMTGIKNSVIIGVGVICLAVPISLAAALMMTQIYERVRPIYYVIVVSPVLMPGVILGISTLVFWDKLGVMAQADYESIFYNGIFLSIVGQSTFISAYCMLIFLARLQRFDRTQEEAALDLG
ncbi:MAG: ABC transporter permease, partial [Rhodospirillales bacterium]|nr:ABC transporter permease [Rhodospirillales bacterium]